MKKLSIGLDSTLENWIILCEMVFGADSKPTLFLKEKVEQSPNGLKEEVVCDEGQLLYVLGKMYVEENRGVK